MKIINKQTHVVAGDDFLTIESKVNKDKLAKLYGLLSNIYRNPIGSIVREYASNAYDANKEANFFKENTYEDCIKAYPWIKDEKFNMDRINFDILKSYLSKASDKEPVVVGIDFSTSQLSYYIQDYGIGLSPERMKHIYFNYLDSTKENTNDEIGGFGIGAKSALSYTNTFHINTVYNGVEYHYIMTKNAYGIPEGQLLMTDENTTKDNGTLIKIPIQTSDSRTFLDEITKQLAYMDNVYMELINYTNPQYGYNNDHSRFADTFNNDKIYNHNDWRYRSNPPMNELHICLENITYSIDWTELNINSIPMNVGLIFKTGELQPTPSRESIVYTKDSVLKIKERIKKLVLGYVKEINDANSTSDFNKFVEAKYQRAKTSSFYIIPDKYSINLDYILISNKLLFEGKTLLKPTFLPFEKVGITLNYSYILFNRYRPVRAANASDGKSISYNIPMESFLKNLKTFYIYSPNTENNYIKNRYLLEEKHPKDNHIIFIRKDNSSEKHLINGLGLQNLPIDSARQLINIFNGYVDKWIDDNKAGVYEDVLIDPNWEKKYAAGNSKYSPGRAARRSNDEIFTKQLELSGSWNKKDFKLINLEDFTGHIIYGEHDDRFQLGDLSKLIRTVKGDTTTKYIYLTMSKTNCKKMEDLKHAHNIDGVVNNDDLKIIGRLATAMKISDGLIGNLLSSGILKGVYDEVHDTYTTLVDYSKDNGFRIKFSRSYTFPYNSELLKGIVTAAIKLNLYDNKMLNKFDSVSDYVKDLELLNYIVFNDNEEFRKAVADFLVLKNKKVNKKYLKN